MLLFLVVFFFPIGGSFDLGACFLGSSSRVRIFRLSASLDRGARFANASIVSCCFTATLLGLVLLTGCLPATVFSHISSSFKYSSSYSSSSSLMNSGFMPGDMLLMMINSATSKVPNFTKTNSIHVRPQVLRGICGSDESIPNCVLYLFIFRSIALDTKWSTTMLRKLFKLWRS